MTSIDKYEIIKEILDKTRQRNSMSFSGGGDLNPFGSDFFAPDFVKRSSARAYGQYIDKLEQLRQEIYDLQELCKYAPDLNKAKTEDLKQEILQRLQQVLREIRRGLDDENHRLSREADDLKMILDLF